LFPVLYWDSFDRQAEGEMALFNHTTRDLTAKIVYYGPGLCGKTTNLKVLHGHIDRAAKGKLLSLATAQDRTIYFDLLPVELGNIKGYTVRFQLCTVPGQVFYNETRKIVLRGVDGIVFVVDSQASMLSHNLESFQNLRENLREEKIALETIPVVIQYNKRDLVSALPVATMQEALGFSAYPFVEATAAEGHGVVETFRLVSKLTFVDLLRRLQRGAPVASETAAAALVAATEAAPSSTAVEGAETVFAQADAETRIPAEPVTVAEPVAAAGEALAAVPSASEPLPGVPEETGASPVFEEFEADGKSDGWSTTLASGFPGIDDEPSLDSSLARRERSGEPDSATTCAIETPAPVVLLPLSPEPAGGALPSPELAPGPEVAALPALQESTELAEEETQAARPAPEEAESHRLKDSLTRALQSISEESARREEVEARLGGRIANLEEDLAVLRRELQESRSREESLRGLTEALGRRWDSLRRLLTEEEAPPT
jgi:signal recognition particle receptor subunit beta